MNRSYETTIRKAKEWSHQADTKDAELLRQFLILIQHIGIGNTIHEVDGVRKEKERKEKRIENRDFTMSGLNLQHKDTNENPFDKQEEETIYVECEEKKQSKKHRKPKRL